MKLKVGPEPPVDHNLPLGQALSICQNPRLGYEDTRCGGQFMARLQRLTLQWRDHQVLGVLAAGTKTLLSVPEQFLIMIS